jgi:hypothetical protein
MSKMDTVVSAAAAKNRPTLGWNLTRFIPPYQCQKKMIPNFTMSLTII